MGERTVIKFRFFSKERGQALVEFALVLPLLLTIIMASMEFGWYYTSRYELSHYSRELGYNLRTPFTLSWKWGDWHTESGRRKPSWMSDEEKAEWSFDDYDGWYALSDPGEDFIGSEYFYICWDTAANFESRLNNVRTILDQDKIDYKIRGGWFINVDALHIPAGGGSGWKAEREQPRTEFYFADITVDISYEYKPLTFIGKMLFCPPGDDSVMLEATDRYTYSTPPLWLSN